MTKTKIRNLLVALVLGAFALTTKGAVAEANAPETAAEHSAAAKAYQDKAASYRKEAELHKEMAAAYKKRAPADKTGKPNPWVAKMEKHCMAIVKDAEKLAADNEKAAEFHTMLAKEAK